MISIKCCGPGASPNGHGNWHGVRTGPENDMNAACCVRVLAFRLDLWILRTFATGIGSLEKIYADLRTHFEHF